MRFRKADKRDAAALAKLRVQFLVELSTNTKPAKSEELETELLTYFKEEMENEAVIAWVADYEGRIVATSTMVIWRPPISFGGIGKSGQGYVLNIYTMPEFRRRGISSKLLDRLIETAQEMQLEKLHLHATNDGMNLYRKLGFAQPEFPELVLKLNR